MFPSHYNPIKRNRNIGTKSAGYKNQSNFKIPWQSHTPFYENVKSSELYQREINGKLYSFVVEKVKQEYQHICSVNAICDVLIYIPKEDLEGLSLIILRQPKKKEEILNPCWGRLQYEYEYRNKVQPAIILEAINLNRCIKIKKSEISPFLQKELDLLKNEGAEIFNDKKRLVIQITPQSAKNTQLYRTFLHEVGHYVYYKNGFNINCYEDKEMYANHYAELIKSLLPQLANRQTVFEYS